MGLMAKFRISRLRSASDNDELDEATVRFGVADRLLLPPPVVLPVVDL